MKYLDFPLSSPGDQMLSALQALSNPHRLRIVAALHAKGRDYVSHLARELALSRPLLHLHLQKLEEAGLVESQFELSAGGKALNYYQLTDFDFRLTPQSIALATASLAHDPKSTD